MSCKFSKGDKVYVVHTGGHSGVVTDIVDVGLFPGGSVYEITVKVTSILGDDFNTYSEDELEFS